MKLYFKYSCTLFQLLYFVYPISSQAQKTHPARATELVDDGDICGLSNCRPPDVVTAATEATAEATAAAFFIFCFSLNLRIISPLKCDGGALGSFPALVLLLFGRDWLESRDCGGGPEGGGRTGGGLGPTGPPPWGCCPSCCCCCWCTAAMAIVRYIWL